MAKPLTRRDDVKPLTRGIYTARLAAGIQDLAAAQTLRTLCFRLVRGLSGMVHEGDRFDAVSRHLLVTDDRSGRLVCCYRVMSFASGAAIRASYSAQFYDLTPLAGRPGPLLELGRFCLHPDHRDPDILRVAWAALTRMMDELNGTMLFGCSSFDGAEPALHRDAMAHLARGYLAPPALQPSVIAPESVDLRALAQHIPAHPPRLPSLLRTYLAMGAWVSDHAVIDRELNTLHVFTGLDVAAVPPARARALRALAAQSHGTS